jgi:hypothetical protein
MNMETFKERLIRLYKEAIEWLKIFLIVNDGEFIFDKETLLSKNETAFIISRYNRNIILDKVIYVTSKHGDINHIMGVSNNKKFHLDIEEILYIADLIKRYNND